MSLEAHFDLSALTNSKPGSSWLGQEGAVWEEAGLGLWLGTRQMSRSPGPATNTDFLLPLGDRGTGHKQWTCVPEARLPVLTF